MYKQNKHIGSQLADEWIDKNARKHTELQGCFASKK